MIRFAVIVLLSVGVAGIIGWVFASFGWVVLVGPLADEVPREKQVPFLADLWAHTTSYLTGVIDGIAVIVRVLRSRVVIVP